MGQGQSTERQEELISGIRVTQELLEQLSGKPRQALKQSTRPQPLPTTRREQQARQDSELTAVQQDQQLAQALQRSRLVGGMLLKKEDEELKQINSMADELIQREYSAPSRPRPCEQYAAACLECYRVHPQDPLQCAMAVDAYAACAKQAWGERMQ